MRLMSFMLTTEQVRRREKTVTRRMGWKDLKPGTLLCAVEKGMGLRKGQTVVRLGVIRVVDVRREPLDRMLQEAASYGVDEVRKEGFAHHPEKSFPAAFVKFFCDTHGCESADDVTRIEFEYVDL